MLTIAALEAKSSSNPEDLALRMAFQTHQENENRGEKEHLRRQTNPGPAPSRNTSPSSLSILSVSRMIL